MPRHRLTPEDLQARITEYCARYGVEPNAEGLPPFPSGQRETPQHRDWIGVYKAHDRLERRQRGQCARCEAPAVDGVLFCETHRARDAGLSAQDRKTILETQNGRCPICAEKVGLRDALDHARARGQAAFLHARCNRLVSLAAGLDRDGLDRLRAYLGSPPPRRPRRR